ncbi:Peptidyl-prolyl cis-trans isomerase fpr2, variant 2 [Mucor circinelloides]
MRLHRLLSFLGILISLTVNAQQQQPSKFQSNILRQSPNCRKRVTSDASIQLQYVAKTLESDDIIDKKIIDLNPGEMTVVKGLEHEILGMCIGEIRRLVVPAALHVCKNPKKKHVVRD